MMDRPNWSQLGELLEEAHRIAASWLETLPERPVAASAGADELRRSLGVQLSDDGEDAVEVLRAMARGAEPGLLATPSPRFFGFVIGGTLPVTIAADWLTTAWDQNAGLFAVSPAASVIEEIARQWLLDLLGLPAGSGMGFVTGGQMANFTGLLAARHEVLRRTGWNVEDDGLAGAPPITVVAGDEAHITIHGALRMLGIGSKNIRTVASDSQGRMDPAALDELLGSVDGPLIVCCQAGNINTGAFDPIERIVELSHARNGWVHVDGAFGLWATASESTRGMVQGIETADSWATDAHKWLNVPYDCGIAIVADARAHRAALARSASYLVQTEGGERDQLDWVPEFSRRARGTVVYAALRALGRKGVAAMIENGCRCARRMAERLGADDRVRILNDVVLNQVLVRFRSADGREEDDLTREVIRRVQADGTCWLAGSQWHGMAVMRVSISGWSTTLEDIDRSARAILTALRSELDRRER